MTNQLMSTGGIMPKLKNVLLILTVSAISALATYYFTNKDSEKEYTVNFDDRIQEVKRDSVYSFMPEEMEEYILGLCEELKVDPDLAVSILLNENPMLDPNAINKNTNGSIDVGLWQLNDRYIYTSFKKQYWKFDKVEVSPFNWKHNTYIALHHIQALTLKLKVFDDIVQAYNCGVNAVINDRVPEMSKNYLARAKVTYSLLQRKQVPPVVDKNRESEAVALRGE